MKKKIIILAVVLLVVAGAFWAKGYYNDRYVVSSCYYTQIPEDEVKGLLAGGQGRHKAGKRQVL